MWFILWELNVSWNSLRIYYIRRMTRSKDSFPFILLFIFSLRSSSLPVVSTLSQSRRSRNYNPSCPFYWSATPPAILVITVSNVSLPSFLSIVLPLSITMLCRYLCYKSLYISMKCSLSVKNLFCNSTFNLTKLNLWSIHSYILSYISNITRCSILRE